MRTKKILIAILAIATFLRLWSLGNIPPHLTPDETALGYNAYSILKTARDEYGNFLPIIFKSFGDYKPGLYIYSTVPSIFIFGLNEFSVRLPSAIAGVVAVYLIFIITKKLFNDEKIALISSALLAINPWHIHFSRGAWEINLSLTLTLAAIYFFLKSFKKVKNLFPSAIFFALTLLSYQGAKLSSLIVLVSLMIIYKEHVFGWFKAQRKVFIKAGLLGIIISLPVILSLFQGKAGRLNIFSVFTYPRPEKYLQDFLDEGNEKIGGFTYYAYHPEALNFARGIIGRWTNHYSDRFLFFEGDWQNERHSPPYQGVFVFADMLLLVLGFYSLVRAKGKAKWFIFLWLFLAPLPAAFSKDQIHAVRTFNMVVPMVMLFSFGARELVNLTIKSKKLFRKMALFGYSVIYLFSFIYFLDSYFVHLSINDSIYWEYGYKQIVEVVTPIQKNYDKVVIQQSYSQPYIYFLFYQKYDPRAYQIKAKLKESGIGDVGQVENIDNIYFEYIDWSKARGRSGTLFVGDPIRIPPDDSKDPEQFSVIEELEYPVGYTAFRLVEVK